LTAFPGNSDTRVFAKWAAEFDRRCNRSRYLTYAQLPETLRAAVLAGNVELPSSVMLVGFDSRTPAEDALIDALRSVGTTIIDAEQPSQAATLMLVNAADEFGEIAACANWIRSHLAQNTGARIAVIVPAIDSCRAEIDRRFRSILAPELDNIAAASHAEPYEFSLGIGLARTPLVATALEILRWSLGPLPVERVSALLLSPHFATPAIGGDEFLVRAEFDAFAVRQQRLLQPSMTVDQLTQFASAAKSADSLAIFLKHLRRLGALVGRKNPAKAERTYTDWAATFHELLDSAGWASSGSLDSVEFQTRRKWESALDELTTLDFDVESSAGHVTYSQALDALARIADDTLFAPESRYAPIQIMEPLESAGSTFDAVWFLRANDLAWPSISASNPLLSWQLQHELKMPGANPERDLDHARHVAERIAGSAPTVIFSYAHESVKGRQRPSPALAGIASLVPCTAETIAPSPSHRAPIALDTFIDDAAIPFPPDGLLRGGAAILQAQAACGFRAFAEKRLFATAIDSVSLGLDPAERGSLIHAVLENFWAETRTQAALKSMTRVERDTQLNRSIDLALHPNHSRPEAGWSAAYLDAERQRLLTLLGQWLDYEANVRRPFTVKAREEKLANVRIGPLELDIRVDRIDTVELHAVDGSSSTGEIIVDYKTGVTKPADWLGDRPDEPQLPLYAVASESPHLAGIAIATIRRGKDLGLRGYQSEEGVLPKASKLEVPSLALQTQQWRSVLEALAEDFYAGRAHVSPKQYPSTCVYCAQRLLCRLDLSTLTAGALDGEPKLDLPPEAGLG
jgi:ATP-dependent helicase/nuclease subunit B